MNSNALSSGDQAHIDVVLKCYAAIFSGNWDEVEKLVSKNLVVEEADGLPYRGVYRGFTALKNLVISLGDYWDDMNIVNDSITAGNGIVVGLLTFTGRAKATGKKVSMPIAEVVEFENGLISSMKPYYWDTKTMCDALGV